MSDAPRPHAPTRYIVGCMTGTSLDGLDAALVEIRGRGLDMTATLLGWHALDLGDLREPLMHLAHGNAAPPPAYMRAARQLGHFYCDGVEQLLKRHPVPNETGKPHFIVAHGQTIWHAPGSLLSHHPPFSDVACDDVSTSMPPASAPSAGMSWQLFDPWPIVHRMNVPVCYDLRQADLIAGGEGAPLTPLSDWVIYREHADMIVNLGGVMNATFWTYKDRGIEGGDVCPCNLLLDGLAQQLFNVQYDQDDRIASRGEVVEEIWRGIDEMFPIHGLGEGSLGREQVTPDVLQAVIERFQKYPPETILRSAIEYIVAALAEMMEAMAPSGIVLAGGGARHRLLVEGARACNMEAELFCLSDDLGIPCEAREAMGFAVLGALSQDGVPISLPQVTGATNPGVAGVWAGLSL